MVEVPLKFGRWEIHCLATIQSKNKVLRTWKERLSFSKDELFFFNPFNKYKEVMEYYQTIEDGKVMLCGRKLYCNEHTFNLFKEEFESITFEKNDHSTLGDYMKLDISFNYSPYTERKT